MQTLQTATNGLLRFGNVQEYDATRHMGKVIFPAMNGIISAWLPVILPSTSGNKSEHHIDIGTHVACLLQGEGVESGIILGAFYDDTNKPVTGNADIWSEEFSDGTTITYDRENHKLEVSCVGEVNVSAKESVTVSTEKDATVTAEGNVNVSGENVTVSSSGNTDITAGGNVSITAGNISITYDASGGALGIKSPGKISLDSGGALDVTSSKNLSMSSSGSINISSPGHVTISGSSVSIPGLVL